VAKTVVDIKGGLCGDFVDWSTGTPNENQSAGIPPGNGTVPQTDSIGHSPQS